MWAVPDSQAALQRELPRGFASLRQALRPIVNDDFSRVVFVSYGNPALRPDGSACGGGQSGFDVHPAFKVDGDRMRRVAEFVGARFLPILKGIVTCAGNACAACLNERPQ